MNYHLITLSQQEVNLEQRRVLIQMVLQSWCVSIQINVRPPLMIKVCGSPLESST